MKKVRCQYSSTPAYCINCVVMLENTNDTPDNYQETTELFEKTLRQEIEEKCGFLDFISNRIENFLSIRIYCLTKNELGVIQTAIRKIGRETNIITKDTTVQSSV